MKFVLFIVFCFRCFCWFFFLIFFRVFLLPFSITSLSSRNIPVKLSNIYIFCFISSFFSPFLNFVQFLYVKKLKKFEKIFSVSKMIDEQRRWLKKIPNRTIQQKSKNTKREKRKKKSEGLLISICFSSCFIFIFVFFVIFFLFQKYQLNFRSDNFICLFVYYINYR